MADAATSNPTLGYSLHQKTTQLIEDFLKNILDNDFQYLDEILAEVKEHFGRRDSVALLPKTPCMKGKRKRIVRSLENSFENQQPSSSPDRTQDKLKDVCQTPESKKPAISPLVSQSPDDFVEPKGRVTRAKTNRARNGSENVEDSCTGKTRGRGAKKQLKGPKRQTRGKKNASKLVVKGEADDKEAKEATPKRQTTRNKRKQEETETLPTGPMKVSSNCNEAQMNSPVQCITKKSKLSVALPDEIPPYTEVFIPETPITECSSKKANIKKDQNTMSSPQVVLTPKSVAEAVQEISTRAIEEENKVISNPVVIVEARTYDNQENDNKNTPEPQEQAISESTVSSTKKTKRRTRSRGSKARYSRGMKRKQDDNDEDDEKNISSTTNNEAELEESTTKMQKLEQSDSDNAVVSSTVSSPVRSQRKSTRSSRASTRRSSRLSIKAAQNQRKTKIRKSRSLVKSSVLFKLSTKKMMPSLKPQKDNDSVVEAKASNTTSDLDELKTNLFEDQESNDIDQAEIVPEIREAQSSTPCKTAKKDSAEENSADEDVETEEEEFHDAHESIAEVDGVQFHDAAETKVNDDETEVVSRPTTRSSSRNQSRESQSSEDADHSLSSGSGSQGSSCKEGNLSQDCSDNDSESQDSQSSKDKVPFYIGPNRVIKNPAGVINSFIKRNTPKKLDNKEKSRLMKRAILEKQEKEKERIEQLELQKQRRIEEQKRKREEKEKKAAELRAARAREEQERREQMEKKLDMRKQQEERARKEKEKEEEIKRKVRLQKKAELDARRKQEEEQRQQKLQEKEEEARRHREMLRRKAEFEEQERQRKIMETKRQQELREQELEREREQEKLRLLREIEEKERKAKEEKEKAEKKMREEKEKEEKERKRIAQLLREKEESERKERERRAKEEKWRQERERKLREERERKLREEREVALQEELEKERQRQKKLEEQRLQEEARLRALHNADSYDMTPPPPPRIRSVASSENYNIDDICSDDSTDDEDAPRKRIPSWAQGAKLKAALINQSMGKFDVEAIFGGVPMPNLDEIFTSKKKKRFYQRTSSAHWDSPPLRTLNRGSTLI